MPILLAALVLHIIGQPSQAISECPGIEMISREEWGARLSRDNATMQMPVPHFFVHHTAGIECQDFESCAATMRGIQNFHMDDRGWDDIGYNFLIGGDGKVYIGRGWKRVGAHTYGFNTVSVAASLMGNFMRKLPSDIMLQTTRKLIDCAQQKGYMTEDFKIHGHRDAGCTDCPGDMLYKIIQKWPRFQPGPLTGSRC